MAAFKGIIGVMAPSRTTFLFYFFSDILLNKIHNMYFLMLVIYSKLTYLNLNVKKNIVCRVRFMDPIHDEVFPDFLYMR